MEANHLLSRRNFYSLSYRDTRGNDIIRCINTASSSRTNPGESLFFFFSKHNFPRLRYILKIHSVWGIFLSAAKNRKKRKKREKKKEKKSLRAVERPSNRKLTSSSLSCFSRRIVATRITFISKDLYRGEHGFRTSSKNFINVFRIVC